MLYFYRTETDLIPEILPDQAVIREICVDANRNEAVVQCTNRLCAVQLAKRLAKILPGIRPDVMEREQRPAAGEWEQYRLVLPFEPGAGVADRLEKEIRRLSENYTYIVECADGTLYTGWTNDLRKRMAAHADGSGCRYTKSHGFRCLAYAENHLTKQRAMQREWEIKQLPREIKQNFIKGWTNCDK